MLGASENANILVYRGILCLPHIVNAQETASETAAAVSGPQVEIGGFVERASAHFQNDNGPDFVGQNDGFMVENARLVADIRQNIMHAHSSPSMAPSIDALQPNTYCRRSGRCGPKGCMGWL